MKKNKTLSLLAILGLPVWLLAQNAGLPDSSFGQMGEVAIPVPSDFGYSGGMVLLPDGKMVVAWQSTPDVITTLALTRLLPDGSLDNSFGSQGTVLTNLDLGIDGTLYKMAVTADQKIIAVGGIANDTEYSAFVARFKDNGELDATFGDNGLVLIDEGDQDDEFNAVYILPDGKILAGGLTLDSANPGFYDMLLVKLEADGQFDTSFGNAGIVTSDFKAGLEGIISLAVQSDGKIVAVGGNNDFVTGDYNMELARYNPDGSLDLSFANNGWLEYGTAVQIEIAYDAAVIAGDKLVFCGISFTTGTSTGQMTLFQLNADGSFDNSFGNGGKVFKEVGILEFGRQLEVQADGKILVSGEALPDLLSGDGYLWVSRFNPDGTSDESFGEADGIAQTPNYSDGIEGIGLLLQPDGKIVATGFGSGKTVGWRFLNDNILGSHEMAMPAVDFSIAPNPSNGLLQVDWEQAELASVSCELVDGQGRLIETIINQQNYPVGANQLKVQIHEPLPASLAFLKLSINGNTTMKPVVFMK
jgi:uncharacterized delta-60 repeat protein